MQTLLENSLNKTESHLILLSQVSDKTIMFTMICALSNKQVMTSVNGVKMPKKRNKQSKIENRFREIAYENNLKIDNRTLGKLRSGVAFGQLSHPTF